jgi:DNA repair exonuclease SbcCD ATPase subunit
MSGYDPIEAVEGSADEGRARAERAEREREELLARAEKAEAECAALSQECDDAETIARNAISKAEKAERERDEALAEVWRAFDNPQYAPAAALILLPAVIGIFLAGEWLGVQLEDITRAMSTLHEQNSREASLRIKTEGKLAEVRTELDAARALIARAVEALDDTSADAAPATRKRAVERARALAADLRKVGASV